MAHPFDEAVDAVRAAIMSADGPMPVGTAHVRGVDYPVFLTAPPDLPRYFSYFCGLYADRECLVDGADRLTFGATLGLARQFAHGLRRHHDVMPGNRIAIAARNGAAWVIAYMGVLMAGGVATLVNAFWTAAEMADAIADAQCALVLADRPRFEALEHLDAEAMPPMRLLDLDVPVTEALAALLADGDDAVLPLPGPDAPATILFTSGSTGFCKGALSDQRAKIHAALNYACSSLAMLALFTRQGRPPAFPPATLLNLPLFHVTAEVAALLHSFAIGRKMVVMPRWGALEALRLIEAEHITYFTGVPLMAMELAVHKHRAAFDLSSLADIAVGGAPRPATHVGRIREGLPSGFPAFGYGLTETNAIGAGIVREACLDHPESAGRPTPPLVDLAIFGPHGEKLGPGERGEIGIRSVAAISGYWNRPAETAALFTPSGHVLTGDIGMLDAHGYLHIVDRKKDIIIRGGENIACAAVEAALYAVPDVTECAVFGVPDERLGELPVAMVALAPGSAQSESTILAALAGRLAGYERPVAVRISDGSLPRLGSEKIDKRALRAAYLDAG